MSGQLAFVLPTEPGELTAREIILPFLPLSKNVWEGYQPMWKSGVRKKWYKALAEAFEENQFPIRAKSVTCHATLVYASKRRRDWQNFIQPMWWFVPDALVDYGCIPDDTPQFFHIGEDGGITFEIDPRKGVDPKLRQKTILRFTFEL